MSEEEPSTTVSESVSMESLVIDAAMSVSEMPSDENISPMDISESNLKETENSSGITINFRTDVDSLKIADSISPVVETKPTNESVSVDVSGSIVESGLIVESGSTIDSGSTVESGSFVVSGSTVETRLANEVRSTVESEIVNVPEVTVQDETTVQSSTVPEPPVMLNENVAIISNKRDVNEQEIIINKEMSEQSDDNGNCLPLALTMSQQQKSEDVEIPGIQKLQEFVSDVTSNPTLAPINSGYVVTENKSVITSIPSSGYKVTENKAVLITNIPGDCQDVPVDLHSPSLPRSDVPPPRPDLPRTGTTIGGKHRLPQTVMYRPAPSRGSDVGGFGDISQRAPLGMNIDQPEMQPLMLVKPSTLVNKPESQTFMSQSSALNLSSNLGPINLKSPVNRYEPGFIEKRLEASLQPVYTRPPLLNESGPVNLKMPELIKIKDIQQMNKGGPLPMSSHNILPTIRPAPVPIAPRSTTTSPPFGRVNSNAHSSRFAGLQLSHQTAVNAKQRPRQSSAYVSRASHSSSSNSSLSSGSSLQPVNKYPNLEPKPTGLSGMRQFQVISSVSSPSSTFSSRRESSIPAPVSSFVPMGDQQRTSQQRSSVILPLDSSSAIDMSSASKKNPLETQSFVKFINTLKSSRTDPEFERFSKSSKQKLGLPTSSATIESSTNQSGKRVDQAANVDFDQNSRFSSGSSTDICASNSASATALYAANTSVNDGKGKAASCDQKVQQPSKVESRSSSDSKNGSTAMPGSLLKIRKNEFGVMEMVTDNDSISPSSNKSNSAKTEKADDESSVMDTDSGSPCLNCSKAHGVLKNGRFCSRGCVEEYNDRRRSSKDRPKSENGDGDKKKRKSSFLDQGGSEPKQFCPDPEASADGVIEPRKSKKKFSWNHYLSEEHAVPAPARIFKCPFPVVKMGFRVKMKLEGIDPHHPSQYCVLSVREIKGFRLQLHFDGYSDSYNFWVNADSPFIFPPGWAEKNGKTLLPPKDHAAESFDWANHLKANPTYSPAPKQLFVSLPSTSVTPNSFRPGMKLEAIDKQSTSLHCVATVVDVLGERILIHFDGWENIYDYWCDLSSPYIHPVGWCQENGKPISPPKDCIDITSFTWRDYLANTKSQPVPARAFKVRPPHGFEVGMKLEVVDKRNPILIRVASIVEVEPYRLKIHFDGWSDYYDYWVDDDCPDLHPPGWCYKTGHPLVPPISPADLVVPNMSGSCPTPGCTGVGHIKGAKYTGHHSTFGCPYSSSNMHKEWVLPDRLASGRSDLSNNNFDNKMPKSIGSSLPIEHKKCPTPGCDGSGHITGRYTAHYRLSGCPLAVENKAKLLKPGTDQLADVTEEYSGVSMDTKDLKIKVSKIHRYVDKDRDRPLSGPGSGRGRRKKKILRLIQKQQEIDARKEHRMEIKKEKELNKSAPATDSSSLLLQGIHQSVFMPSMLTTPVKDPSAVCWQQHKKLLPDVGPCAENSLTQWTVAQTAEFVATIPGCSHLAKHFIDHEIDGESITYLSQTDMIKSMNIKLGPAIKIYNSILVVKNSSDVV